MKYLILLLLILSSCTDKENTNQESSTQDMPIVFEDSEKLQTNTDPLIASYDIENNLFLISDNIRDYSIFWDPTVHIYYKVSDYKITNDIVYSINPSEAKKHRYFYDREYNDKDEIQYVGSISKNELVYFNTNNQLILLTITPIDDSFLEDFDGTLYSNTSPFYPYNSSVYTNKQGDNYWRGGGNRRLIPTDPDPNT